METLFLAGRLEDDLETRDENVRPFLLARDGESNVLGSIDPSQDLMDVTYRNRLEIYTFELNQIIEYDSSSWIFGARLQSGSFDVTNTMSLTNPGRATLFENPPVNLSITEDVLRLNLYGYVLFEPLPDLRVTAAVTYDSLDFPINVLTVPVTPGAADKDRVSPKVGVVWDYPQGFTFRAGYSQSRGGVSFD